MKILTSFLIAIILTVAFPAPAEATAVGAPNFDVGAQAAYLYNIDTDKLIWELNADTPLYPASLTKLMTAVLALENTQDLDEDIVAFPAYVQNYLYEYQRQYGAISLGGMVAGQEFSMRAMLYAIMLPSANEAAMCVAHHIGGSQEEFVRMMNARARELGMTNTNFANANGLFDPEHVTTARDMFILTQHAMSLPEFMDIASTLVYESEPTNRNNTLVWHSTNLMMNPANNYYYPHLRGIKTGTLPQSGRCFISTATKDGFTYLLVVMDSPYIGEDGKPMASNTAFEDTHRLYEWVFSTYRRKSLVEQGRYVKEVPLRLSMDKDHLQLMTASRFTALVPNSIEASSVTMLYDVPEHIDAPVRRGDLIGTMTLVLGGEELGTVELLAGETVNASQMLVLWERTKAVLRSFWFKFGVIFCLLLIISYVVLMVARNKRRRKMGGFRPRRRI